MRSLAGAFRGELESPLSSEVAVIFITVDHPDLQVPIRINTDIVDYIYGGNTFTGTGINIGLLSDDEQVPRLQVSFVNVDRTIGQTILALTTPPRIKLELLAKSDFDEAIPRNPLGTPTVEYSAPHLYLRNVTCDAMTIAGEIQGQDFSAEPYPSNRCTPNRFPGLFP